MQAAIDAVSGQGGGKLLLPKGTYSFSSIYMKSNVHLLIDKGVVIKPFLFESQQGNCVFHFTNQSDNRKGEEGFIENVHAVYGENAPVATKAIGELTDAQLKKLWFDEQCMLIRGPSRWVARDRTGGSWDPVIKNVTSEGFPASTENTVRAGKQPRRDYRLILKNYPVWNELPDYLRREKIEADTRKQKPRNERQKP